MVKRVPVRAMGGGRVPAPLPKRQVVSAPRASSAPWVVAGICGFGAGALVVGGILAFLVQQKPVAVPDQALITNSLPSAAPKEETALGDGGASIAQRLPEFSNNLNDIGSAPSPSESNWSAKPADVTEQPRLTITSPPPIDPRLLGSFESHTTESR